MVLILFNARSDKTFLGEASTGFMPLWPDSFAIYFPLSGRFGFRSEPPGR
jgi:hypothetical protein